MEWYKKGALIGFALLVIALFLWAIYAPKSELSETIEQTLKEQEKRADLTFEGVTFAEVEGGVKFWEIKARSSSLDKDKGIARLSVAYGTFFDKGRPSIRFITPNAVWYMNDKRIDLIDVVGYDVRSEDKVKKFLSELKEKTLSTFSLPSPKDKSSGYLFRAKNLGWGMSSQKLTCRGGIWLTKGEVTGTGKELEADVALEEVILKGDPSIKISNEKDINIKADEFKVDSVKDVLSADGGVIITSENVKITTEKMRYKQRQEMIEITDDVIITYRDTKATSGQGIYDVIGRKITLTKDTKLIRGGSVLTGDNIIVSLKDNTFKVTGSTKVVIPEKELN